MQLSNEKEERGSQSRKGRVYDKVRKMASNMTDAFAHHIRHLHLILITVKNTEMASSRLGKKTGQRTSVVAMVQNKQAG